MIVIASLRLLLAAMVSLPDADVSGGMDLFAPPVVLQDPGEPLAKRLKFSPDSVASDFPPKMLGLVWYPVECCMQTLNITCKHSNTEKQRLFKKTLEHLRSLCCGKNCTGALQETPSIMSLRQSLDAMGNDEKNATVMAILKQGIQDYII